MPSDVECAYMAAFLDGEGYVSIQVKPKRKGVRSHILMVGVSNTHKPTLNTLKSIWGGHLSKTEPDGSNTIRTLYKLRWQYQRAAEVLRAIEPYMITKKEQCRIGLKLVARIGGKSGCDAVTEEEWNAREDLRMQLREYRTKGRGSLVGRLLFVAPPEYANVCEYCGVYFVRKWTSRYCREKCRMAAWHREHTALKAAIEYQCQHCGTLFSAKRRGRLFCSKACGMAAAYRRKKDQP